MAVVEERVAPRFLFFCFIYDVVVDLDLIVLLIIVKPDFLGLVPAYQTDCERAMYASRGHLVR